MYMYIFREYSLARAVSVVGKRLSVFSVCA